MRKYILINKSNSVFNFILQYNNYLFWTPIMNFSFLNNKQVMKRRSSLNEGLP